MSEVAETSAKAEAESILISRYKDEFDELFRVECLKRDIAMVTVCRTVYKRVTELEAVTLVRHGWQVIE